MKIKVDYTRCIGAGMCTSIAPTLFELDDDGKLILRRELTMNDEEASAVRDAVACCPAEALSIEP